MDLTASISTGFLPRWKPSQRLADVYGTNIVLNRNVGNAGQRDVTTPDFEDDSVAIALINKGWRDAYARIVTRYQAEIARYMWRFTRDAAVCEELVHETFVQAYLSLPTYRGEAPLLFWLRKIATRVGYKFWRERARQKQRFEPLHDNESSADSSVIQCPQETYDKEQVYLALDRLATRDRLVLTLLYLEEMSVEEAAATAGWSKSMVKVQAFRARYKMRKLLEFSEKGGIDA